MKTVLSDESIATLNQIIHSEQVLINLVHESTMLLDSHFLIEELFSPQKGLSSKEMNSHFEKYGLDIISHEILPRVNISQF